MRSGTESPILINGSIIDKIKILKIASGGCFIHALGGKIDITQNIFKKMVRFMVWEKILKYIYKQINNI
jgi:hypothetical protein